jgi:Flp pilus assembly protein TadD
LQKATAIDPKLDSAHVQLGNLYFARRLPQEAVGAYEKAVATNPSNSEAHYRLGLAYKQLGEKVKAQHEFEEYKQLDKTEAEATERRRRDLRQFLFVLQDRQSDLKNPSTPAVSK